MRSKVLIVKTKIVTISNLTLCLLIHRYLPNETRISINDKGLDYCYILIVLAYYPQLHVISDNCQACLTSVTYLSVW